MSAGKFPLVLGGDHSVAVGTVAGVSDAFRQRGEKIGLIWIDAHADMNTPESSPSGNVHGMPLACCLGSGPRELTHHFRLRSESGGPKRRRWSDSRCGFARAPSRARIRRDGVHDARYRRARVARRDGARQFELASDGTAGFHLSLDMDAVDPDEAPGVGTPVRGGMTYREAHLAMEMICDSGRMISMEIVEVNPVLDEANRTALLGVELVMSAMGKKIL